MTAVARAICAALLVGALGGCQIPRDTTGTLERVEGGTLRVGVTEADPFVRLGEDGQPSGGAEVRLVERLAAALDARIEWFDGSESELMGALKERQLDLVIGGLTKKAPWKKEAALTRPYLSTRTVVGAPPGQDLPGNLDGVRVAVEAGSEEAGLLDRETEAEPVFEDEIERGRVPAAVGDWLLDDLGLVDTGVELKREEHVMAARLGENAWLVRLERFLLARKHEARALLEEEGAP